MKWGLKSRIQYKKRKRNGDGKVGHHKKNKLQVYSRNIILLEKHFDYKDMHSSRKGI